MANYSKTVDNKKTSEIATPEFAEMGTARPFQNIDSTADVKDKLARKLGYFKKGDTAMPLFMTRAFAEFQALKKKQQLAAKNKEKA